MALAVSATIGVRARPLVGLARRGSPRVAVGPSITGICMSIRITSQSPASQASTACCAVVDHRRLDADLVQQGLQHQLVDRVVLGGQHAQRDRRRARLGASPAAGGPRPLPSPQPAPAAARR